MVDKSAFGKEGMWVDQLVEYLDCGKVGKLACEMAVCLVVVWVFAKAGEKVDKLESQLAVNLAA